MIQLVTSLAAGLVFGIGLIVSGMSDPGKVIGFLDLAGAWDPSLGFVMGGAVLVAFFGYRVAAKHPRSLAGAMRLPTSRDIDVRLVLGSIVFGIGWGLAGYCPGPALVSLGSGRAEGAWFVAAMLAGMLIYEAAQRLIHAPARARVTDREP